MGRQENWTNKISFEPGERVVGLFYEVPFTGTVVQTKEVEYHPTEVEMLVEFDEVINCGYWRGKRKRGMISAFTEQETNIIKKMDEERTPHQNKVSIAEGQFIPERVVEFYKN